MADRGKIHRLHWECPLDECGAGVCMASHFDTVVADVVSRIVSTNQEAGINCIG